MSETIFVFEDGEKREATNKEIAEITAFHKEQGLIEKEIESKSLIRKSALAKLAALGLTEEEIAAL